MLISDCTLRYEKIIIVCNSAKKFISAHYLENIVKRTVMADIMDKMNKRRKGISRFYS
jgi:hypothetical protein